MCVGQGSRSSIIFVAEQNEGIVIPILQVTIVEAHRKAVNNGHFTYDDPTTGLKVSFQPDVF